MNSKELYILLRSKFESDDAMCEGLAHMLSGVAGILDISGSKNDIYDAIGSLLVAAGHEGDK